jgi:hypothetical protein
MYTINKIKNSMKEKIQIHTSIKPNQTAKKQRRNLELTYKNPVAHACNPSYSGGRNQEDRGSKPAQAKQFRRPYLEKKPSSQKKDCWP